MEQILIEVGVPANKEILLALLPKLNSRVVSRVIPKPESNESPVDSLKRIAAREGLSHLAMGLSGNVKLVKIAL